MPGCTGSGAWRHKLTCGRNLGAIVCMELGRGLHTQKREARTVAEDPVEDQRDDHSLPGAHASGNHRGGYADLRRSSCSYRQPKTLRLLSVSIQVERRQDDSSRNQKKDRPEQAGTGCGLQDNYINHRKTEEDDVAERTRNEVWDDKAPETFQREPIAGLVVTCTA